MPGPIYNTSGGSGKMERDVFVNVQTGNYAPGDTILKDTAMTDVWAGAVQKLYFPTYQNPSANLADNVNNLQEIGAVIDTTLTLNFNRGKILGKNEDGIWNAAAQQNPRAGAAVSYELNGKPAQAGNSLLVENYEVTQGNNVFSGKVNFSEGPQPKDSSEQDFETPLEAGSITDNISFEGVRALYATTANITTATKQALVSMLNGNNIEMVLVAESGGDKQFFDIPTAWLDARPLAKVEFYNPVSGQFDPTDQMATFTVSDVSHGATYKRYTNNTSDRGAITLRLKF